MNGCELLAALHGSDRVYGTAIISPSPKWPLMVQGLGVDFVFIDTEHIAISRETLSWMCRAYQARNLAPVVRIPEPDPYLATMVLDGGASGVIAPYVESADQVRALRGAVKLRPLKGRRLQRVLHDDEPLEPELASYLDRFNAGNVLVINTESVPAVEAIDELLSVPQLDAVLVGPHDLTTNLGIPEQYDHPRFDETVRTIIRQARKRNVGAGVHYWMGLDREIEWARAGANLIVHSSDIDAARFTLTAEIQQIRAALGDQRGQDETESGII